MWLLKLSGLSAYILNHNTKNLNNEKIIKSVKNLNGFKECVSHSRELNGVVSAAGVERGIKDNATMRIEENLILQENNIHIVPQTMHDMRK